ncbi:hypothetical protein C8Q74DRAFT_446903 [Fomes fomentarius]|nr:hypothetical protein C8Q74DRAFT_446903 [Fomes fomentarius]
MLEWRSLATVVSLIGAIGGAGHTQHAVREQVHVADRVQHYGPHGGRVHLLLGVWGGLVSRCHAGSSRVTLRVGLRRARNVYRRSPVPPSVDHVSPFAEPGPLVTLLEDLTSAKLI